MEDTYNHHSIHIWMTAKHKDTSSIQPSGKKMGFFHIVYSQSLKARVRGWPRLPFSEMLISYLQPLTNCSMNNKPDSSTFTAFKDSCVTPGQTMCCVHTARCTFYLENRKLQKKKIYLVLSYCLWIWLI